MDTEAETVIVDATEWVQALVVELRELDRRFSALDPNDDRQRLGAYILAVTTVSSALKLLPGFDVEMTTLRDLAHKLEDVSRGNHALAPPLRETTGRAPEGIKRDFIKARAVAAIDFMIGNDIDRKEALEFATQRLRELRVKGRQGKLIKLRSVKEWRDKIHNPTDADDPVAREEYLKAIKLIDEVAPQGVPKERVKKLVSATLLNELCS